MLVIDEESFCVLYDRAIYDLGGVICVPLGNGCECVSNWDLPQQGCVIYYKGVLQKAK